MNFKSPTSLPQDVRFIGLPGSAIDLVSGLKMFEGYSHFSIFIVTVYNFSYEPKLTHKTWLIHEGVPPR